MCDFGPAFGLSFVMSFETVVQIVQIPFKLLFLGVFETTYELQVTV